MFLRKPGVELDFSQARQSRAHPVAQRAGNDVSDLFPLRGIFLFPSFGRPCCLAHSDMKIIKVITLTPVA